MEDSGDDSADRSESDSAGNKAATREVAGTRGRAPPTPGPKQKPKRRNHGDLGVEEARRLEHLARRRELAKQVSPDRPHHTPPTPPPPSSPPFLPSPPGARAPLEVFVRRLQLAKQVSTLCRPIPSLSGHDGACNCAQNHCPELGSTRSKDSQWHRIYAAASNDARCDASVPVPR